MLDIERLRRETPACNDVLHLDHAGSSLPPLSVQRAVHDHLNLEAKWGGYRAAHARAEQLEDVYRSVAELIGSESDEVALVDSATRAWMLAFAAVPFRPGDRIICSRSEYASNHLAFLQLQRRVAVQVVAVGSDESGSIDVAELRHEVEQGAALVALTHVPTNGGLVQPAAKVGRICRDADVPFLLDACQSAGQVHLADVPWDMIAATGRKYLRGPRGTGLLGVRRAWLNRLTPPTADLFGATWTGAETYTLRPDARRFELWERNYAALLGLGEAVQYALDCGIGELEQRIATVADGLRARLTSVPGVRVRDEGAKRCGIVTFTIDEVDATQLKLWMRERDVHISVSRRSSTLLNMDDRGLGELVRASVHALNTEAELDRFVRLLDDARTLAR